MIYEPYRDNMPLYKRDKCWSNEHFHKAIELIYNLGKDRTVYISMKPVFLKKDSVLVVMPYQVHRLPNEDDNDGICTVLPSRFSDKFLKRIGKKMPAQGIFEDENLCERIKTYMTALVDGLNDDNEFTREGYINLLLGIILDNMQFEENATKQQTYDFIQKVVAYINEHYAEDLTLESLSQIFGYSKYYFSRTFNKYFATNLKDYINAVRIFKAIELTDTYRPSEIYYKVGFSSIQQYITYFKKFMHTTPSKFSIQKYWEDKK